MVVVFVYKSYYKMLSKEIHNYVCLEVRLFETRTHITVRVTSPFFLKKSHFLHTYVISWVSLKWYPSGLKEWMSFFFKVPLRSLVTNYGVRSPLWVSFPRKIVVQSCVQVNTYTPLVVTWRGSKRKRREDVSRG